MKHLSAQYLKITTSMMLYLGAYVGVLLGKHIPLYSKYCNNKKDITHILNIMIIYRHMLSINNTLNSLYYVIFFRKILTL